MNITREQVNSLLKNLRRKPENYLFLEKASLHREDKTVGVCPKEKDKKAALLFFYDNTIYELPKDYSKYESLDTKTIPKTGAFFYKVPLSDFKKLKQFNNGDLEKLNLKTPNEIENVKKPDITINTELFDISKTIQNLPVNVNTHIDNILNLIQLSCAKKTGTTDIKSITRDCISAYGEIITAVKDI